MREFHPLVKRWLDGELTADQLGAELAAELAEARALLSGVDHSPVTLGQELDQRVMAAVRSRPATRWQRAWRWIGTAHELRLRVRPWAVAALAAAAMLVILLAPARQVRGPAVAQAPESVYVKFVLFAPGAHQVSVAGTFNGWDAHATPLARADAPGVDDGFGRRNSILAVTPRGARVS